MNFARMFEISDTQLLAQALRNKDGLYCIQFSIYGGSEFDVVDMTIPFPSEFQRDLAFRGLSNLEAAHFHDALSVQVAAQKRAADNNK